ncbi:ABC transporter ATP-binding protein [Ornithinimicrobium pratense]|uniref:ABC transporter ATP-binding protein n=1 Tax=Ornithinimicrobium pratense TaxID=2593973 RepID=A0A5J6V5A3_9MICO|nr:ABC transporter ATP-binding protein [Ornithinimicrobium pratense]QFG68193.1 ABC transporter ATP-binding protein [Ornithinimicrobium pratense]
MSTSTDVTARPQPPSRHDTGDPVIRVQHLRKSYAGTPAVRDVSFEVRRGEIFGILGSNGAGKTTTVEIVANLRQADGGEVEVLGVDPSRHPAYVKERLGIQLQESTLQGKITPREALRLYAAFYPDPEDPEVLLRLLGLENKADTPFDNLSGGQKQRLSIALALVGRPEIAILDELTTGLDPQARRETWGLIERVRDSGVTIVLVTHFMDEAERLCDRLIVIAGGVVAAHGSPAELTGATDGGRAFRIALPYGHTPTALGLEALAEVTSITPAGRAWMITGTDRVLPAVVLALSEQDVIPDEVQTQARSLEDVFVELVTTPQESS